MVSRFQIEDMVTQDASGVVFRALDTKTDLIVAVRRFFPFGVNGGGLNDEEQADYALAVERLSSINHPAMRSIICGGCDPVDGMPYIATEWVEGVSLQAFIDQGPISPEQASHLLTQALEVCEQISQVLGEEDVWVETDAQTIIVGPEGSGRGITFWISPLRWLGKRDDPRGLEPIASLAEDIMDWRGKTILDHDGGGLGGWLIRLRGTTTRITLSEAREMLAGVNDATPSTVVNRAVLRAVQGEALKTPRRKSSLPFVIFGTITLAAISLGGWALIRWNNARLNAATAAMVEETPHEELVTAAPTEPPAREKPPALTESVAVAEAPAPAVPPAQAEPVAAVKPATIVEPAPAVKPVAVAGPVAASAAPNTAPTEPKSTPPNPLPKEPAPAKKDPPASQKDALPKPVFTLANSAELLKMENKEVTFVGVLKDFENSNDKKNLYLVFSDNPSLGEARGSVVIRGAPADLSKKKLASFKDKNIKLSGKVRIDNFNKTPVISIQNGAAIQEIK